MSGGTIPDEIIERVRESFDIVDLISEYVPLKRAGQNFKGLCPFHQEKTPSFSVNPARQIFHCFGCGAGGNIFGFLARHEGFSFPEAVRTLADRAGITIPDDRRHALGGPDGEERDILLRVNAEASLYYHVLLRDDPRAQTARAYLAKRKVDGGLWEEFSLGYALPAWDGLLKHLTGKGFTPRQVERAGLAIARREAEGYYDRFRGRLIFPIRSAGGKVVAFGGRILEAETDQPKYLNSPETPVYIKGDNLYALDLAKEHIRRQGYALLVEGYMDAIMCHQHGITNAVATLGTALTAAQLRLMGRFSKKVAFLYDADQAGMAAMARSLDLFIENGIRANIVVLPSGDDPDSFLCREGRAGLSGLLKGSVRLMDHCVKEVLKEGKAGSEDDRLASVEKALHLAAKAPGAIERAEIVKKIADETGVEEAILRDELRGRVAGGTTAIGRKERIKVPGATSRKAEEVLLHLMLADEEICRRVLKEVSEKDFSDPVLSRIVALLASLPGKGLAAGLLREENGEETNRRLTQLAAGEFGIEDKEQTLADSLKRIRKDAIQRELEGITKEMQRAESAGDSEKWKELARRQKAVQQRLQS